ncbi:MIP/aquaporin family protein [Nitrosomonas ureae]|uniref:Glycerol uptake facilitator protein n=1 Tax=Nitrosomonas ureae TaxID=44577 RepID=A0A1H5WWS9_9PROT|nr:MIP/aquaporin family protein [Nitrosomonas ureae]SEG03934.1 glycerol uptake facilitator protein [Nitrosomonas ureae]
MTPFLGELIGTFILVLLGNGVVANVVLNKSKGNNAGWLTIAAGWGIALFVAVYAVAASSGAHLNPAVSIGLAAAGKFAWNDIPIYAAGQMLGAMLGALIVWITYRQHFDATTDPDMQLAAFCTGPAIRSPLNNIITEAVGTFMLVFGIMMIVSPHASLGALDALPVALLLFGIGLSLGGPTGFAVNPARDLGPRIMHAILPMTNKRDSDWGYAYVPVVGGIIGGLLAAVVYSLL